MRKEEYYQDLEEGKFDHTIIGGEEGLNLVTFNNDAFATNVLYDDILREIARELSEICCFYRIDYAQAPTLTQDLGIKKIPIILFYQGGKCVDHLKGIYPKSYIIDHIYALI
ncbi:MAG: thioredoxin family protein [Bacteroidota bacterium]